MNYDAEKLNDPEYRDGFVSSQINIGIPFQIRAMLKARPGWTQHTLAEKTGMLQPRISSLMTPGKTRPNIETLRRIAKAFDCALIVRFAPFSELLQWSERFDPESFDALSFEQEREGQNQEDSTRSLSMVEPDRFVSQQIDGTSITRSELSGVLPRRPPAMASDARTRLTNVIPIRLAQ